MSYIGKQPTKAPLTASDIEDGIITAAKIEDGAVVAAEIASNAVTTAKINADAVTGAKIADDAINSEHYTDGSIDTAHIADANVTTAKIADDAVTYAKIQNVSATDRILGRDSSGAGVIEEITPANLRTMLNVADGATAGGGKLLQVVHAHTGTIANSSSTSYADTGLTASITPSATSSKVIVIINQSVAKMGGANSSGNFRVYRDSTEIGGTIAARAVGYTNNTEEIYLGMAFNYNFQDSPSSTSSVTYKTQFNNGAGTGTIRCQPDSSQSYILLMEVAG